MIDHTAGLVLLQGFRKRVPWKDAVRSVVLETQENLRLDLSTWRTYLDLLRNGRLYGGDLEISALIAWTQTRGRQLLIRVWTAARTEPQDHGHEGGLVWHFALLGAHYRVIQFE